MNFLQILGVIFLVIGIWTIVVAWKPDALGGRVESLYERLTFIGGQSRRDLQRANRRARPGMTVAFGIALCLLGLFQIFRRY